MRFDLLVQEFIRDALIDKKISIFGEDFWRPLIHVTDMVDACLKIINNDFEKTSGQIFNVGSDKENYTKKQLAEIILEYLPETQIEIVKSKVDPRNYKVSFEKIQNSLKFNTQRTVRDSVIEILDQIKSGNIDPRDSEFSNMSKMTEKIKPLTNYQFDENL